MSANPYTQHVRRRGPTPQSQAIPDTDQVPNAAGGYVWQTDSWQQLRRFLVLGSAEGSYYIGERELTRANAKVVEEAIKQDGLRVVQDIFEVSDKGLAPKQDPALFALALVFTVGSLEAKRAAVKAFPLIVRTGTHLFQFLAMVTAQKGITSAIQSAIRFWYQSKTPDQIAYQLVKYQNREGWTHRDAVTLGHVGSKEEAHANLLRYIRSVHYGVKAKKDETPEALKAREGELRASLQAKLPHILDSVAALRSGRLSPPLSAMLIASERIPREALPTELLNHRDVWGALLNDMPMHALVRNLGVMSAKEVLTQKEQATVANVVLRLTNREYLAKSRMHPVSVILASRTYGQGHGEKGKLSWTPVPQIIDALEDAFEKSFDEIVPSGKRIVVAIDGSGSMNAACNGAPLLTCREAAVLMGLATVRSELWAQVVGFTTGAWPVVITKRSTMRDAITEFNKRIIPEGTDCAAPIELAIAKNWDVDLFLLATDSETWAGSEHPAQALERYRRKTGIPAKMVVMAMTANSSTIADPKDPNQLNVVGFDASAPAVISAFARGEV